MLALCGTACIALNQAMPSLSETAAKRRLACDKPDVNSNTQAIACHVTFKWNAEG